VQRLSSAKTENLIARLSKALTSIGIDSLDVDIIANSIGLATEGKQDTMITALQLIDDLRNALTSVGTDSLDIVGAVVSTPIVAPSIADSNVIADDARVELVATRNARRGLVIQNADTVDTVWIGNGAVTTGTGIELLPKQTVHLSNYTGATASIYGICSAGKTVDVRILEVF